MALLPHAMVIWKVSDGAGDDGAGDEWVLRVRLEGVQNPGVRLDDLAVGDLAPAVCAHSLNLLM